MCLRDKARLTKADPDLELDPAKDANILLNALDAANVLDAAALTRLYGNIEPAAKKLSDYLVYFYQHEDPQLSHVQSWQRRQQKQRKSCEQ